MLDEFVVPYTTSWPPTQGFLGSPGMSRVSMVTLQMPDAVKPSSRSRWYPPRFRVRALMLLVLLFGGGLGGLHTVRTAENQRGAVAAIKAVHGYVFYDCDRDPHRMITVRQSTFHKYVPRRSNIIGQRPPERLGIDYFHNVVEVVLPGYLSDAELVLVGRFPQVERVWHAGPSHWLTDAGLTHLDGLANLRELDLSHAPITDAGLVHLKGMSGLEQLNLALTPITDAGLVHLSGLSNLKALNIRGTDVGNPGVVHLKKLTSLRSLDVSGTDVDELGARELRRALPRASVLFQPIDDM
jgi:Leucine rich repeat